MADERPAKTAKPGSPAPTAVETLIFLIFLLALVTAILARLNAFYNVLQSGQYTTGVAGDFVTSILFPFLVLAAYLIAGLAFIGTIWNIVALTRLNEAQNAIYHPHDVAGAAPVENKKNRRWERVLEHLNSANSSDWKLAILEADIILDELLQKMGYQGATVSDKLKSIEPSDFVTLEAAWEAHKVRNTIAHEGSDFVITEREVRRVIELYRTVFEEFHFI